MAPMLAAALVDWKDALMVVKMEQTKVAPKVAKMGFLKFAKLDSCSVDKWVG